MLEICHNLVMPNGVRKSTETNRNKPVLEKIIKLLENSNLKEVDILDIGSSIGIDAFYFNKELANILTIKSYTLGDLYTELLIDENNKLVYDQEGNLLQILKKGYFYNIYFQYYHKFHKYLNLLNEMRSKYYIYKYKYNINNKYIKYLMVIPEIKANNEESVFKLKNMNVFETLDMKYNLIICMHLLNEYYFTKSQIQIAKNNLQKALKPNGILITGQWTKFEVFSV